MDVPQCQVLGYGRLPPDFFGLPNDFDIDRQDHTQMHHTPLSQAEIHAGYTRLMQLRQCSHSRTRSERLTGHQTLMVPFMPSRHRSSAACWPFAHPKDRT